MFGHYYDTRPQKNFVPIYTRVPYLDTEIFNIEAEGLRCSRRARACTTRVIDSIERTKKKSEALEGHLRDSRLRQEENDRKFIEDMQVSQQACLDRSRTILREHCEDLHNSRVDYVRDQKYLNDILASNSTKAASRISSVRRWH